MNQYYDTTILPNPSLRDRAKGVLAGGFGPVVLAFFLAWLIGILTEFLATFLLSIIEASALIFRSITVDNISLSELLTQMQDPAFLAGNTRPWLIVASLLITLIVQIFAGVFNAGLALYSLNLACGRRAGITDIFYGFQHQFGKTLCLAAVAVLTRWIYVLPANIYYRLNDIGFSSSLSGIFLALTAVGFVISYYIYLHISQCFYLLLDFPDRKAKELLRLSARIMDGHKKRFLLLQISFLPLFMISLLTFCIGNLWLVPYREVTNAFFFLNLMQARNQNR